MPPLDKDLRKAYQADCLLVSQRKNGVYLKLYFLEEGEWQYATMTQENRVTIERPKMFIKAFKAGEILISPALNGMRLRLQIKPIRLDRGVGEKGLWWLSIQIGRL